MVAITLKMQNRGVSKILASTPRDWLRMLAENFVFPLGKMQGQARPTEGKR